MKRYCFIDILVCFYYSAGFLVRMVCFFTKPKPSQFLILPKQCFLSRCIVFFMKLLLFKKIKPLVCIVLALRLPIIFVNLPLYPMPTLLFKSVLVSSISCIIFFWLYYSYISVCFLPTSLFYFPLCLYPSSLLRFFFLFYFVSSFYMRRLS